MEKEFQLVDNLNLKPGDRIVVPKSGAQLIQHHALYLGFDNNGNHFICENVIGEGVKLTRVCVFFNGTNRITRIEKFNGENIDRKKVVQDALTKLGQPYNLINYNCESFVNEVLLQKRHSKQVQNAFGLLGLGLLIALIIKNN